ncbi:MAG: glycosyltransferase [Bradymonadaceae bacterium]
MSGLTVVQSCKRWLPRTQKWLHRQIQSLPDDVATRVVCRETLNLDEFPVDSLEVFDERRVEAPLADRLLWHLRRTPVVEDAVEGWELSRWVGHRSSVAEGADLVHSHFGPVAWRDVEVARRADAAHVATFYGYDVSLLPKDDPRWRDRYRDLFDAVTGVLAEGPSMRQKIVHLGCPAEKVRVHHLGVDPDALAFEPRSLAPDEPVRILVAASFKPKKGIPDAVEALGRLQDELDFELTIAGDATDLDRSQREKRRIERAIETYDLEDRVDRRGFLEYEKLLDEFLEHHFLLSPSRTSARGDSEGGAPVTLIAAQATGMPVVSTTHADIPNVVLDGETGLLGPENDPGAVADNIRRLVARADEWPEMGEHARRHVEEEFDASRQGRRLAEIYRELVDEAG